MKSNPFEYKVPKSITLIEYNRNTREVPNEIYRTDGRRIGYCNNRERSELIDMLCKMFSNGNEIYVNAIFNF